MLAAEKKHFELREVGNITVVTLTDNHIIDFPQIDDIGFQLFRLIEEEGRTKTLLSLSEVEFMSSAMLGKLIAFKAKVYVYRGRLVLCEINPAMRPAFRITGLNKKFTICETEERGLQLF